MSYSTRVRANCKRRVLRCPKRQRRLDVELLETRKLLSNFAVTSTADDGSTGTLRWAVKQANAATTPSTINFTLGSGAATITLTEGQLVLSNTADPTTIEGPGRAC